MTEEEEKRKDTQVLIPRVEQRALTRPGYSHEELIALYEIARQALLSGDAALADRVSRGLISVAPDFAHAWLVQAYVGMMRDDFDRTIFSARQALRVEPRLLEALLFLVIAYFNTEDFQSGGTFLGEVSDACNPADMPPRIRKIYDAQVLQFQQRLQKPPSRKPALSNG